MNLMKHLLLTICLVAIALAATSTPARAASTVNWSASDTNGLAFANGTLVTEGTSLLRIGTFDISDANITANKNDVSYLLAHFSTFGSGTVGQGATGYDGAWAIASPNGTPSFGNKQIYLWALYPDPGSGTPTQEGIFYSTLSNWKFPSDTDTGSTSLDLEEVDTALVGSLNGAANGWASLTTQMEIIVVPEPSAFLLVGMGLAALPLMRRRRK